MSTITVSVLLINQEKEPIGSAFCVKIGEAECIDNLKKEVKKELKDLEADTLMVYKLCKPRPSSELTHNFLETIQLLEKEHSENTDESKTAFLLHPENEIGRVGPWPKQAIHILVQRPLPDLQVFYNQSWGKPWPTRKESLPETLSDDLLGIDVDPDDDIDISDDEDDASTQSASPREYTCLVDIRGLAKACRFLTPLPNVIVMRDEYITLRDMLEASEEPFVLTGQPGIGKTAFLIYLFLHRLENKLPTALQTGPDQYIFFDENGVSVRCHSNPKLPDSCWALTDSNNMVEQPCLGFQASPARIIQTTPPTPKNWESRFKHALECSVIVVDLPKPLEVAAIAQEMGFNPSTAIELMEEWGPCTRTIIKMLRAPSRYTDIHRPQVGAAARRLVRDKSFREEDYIGAIDEEYTPLLFIFPIRDSTLSPSSKFDLHIPTAELLAIYYTQCRRQD